MITKSDVNAVIGDFVRLAKENHRTGMEWKRLGVSFNDKYEKNMAKSFAYLLCARHVKENLMDSAADDLNIENLIHEKEERHESETDDPYTAAQADKQQ